MIIRCPYCDTYTQHYIVVDRKTEHRYECRQCKRVRLISRCELAELVYAVQHRPAVDIRRYLA